MAIDPMGTQFGLRVELSIDAPFPKRGDFRAFVFTFEARKVEPNKSSDAQSADQPVAAQPQLTQIQAADYQPQLLFNNDGKAALVLPTPRVEELDSSTRRSKAHAITVYRDLNGDGEWNENEPFVAALPQTLSYIGSSSGKPERWVINPDAASLINTPGEDAVPSSFALTRLDRFRTPATLRGQSDNLGLHSDFVAMMSTAEVQDLRANFMPRIRPLDVHLRGLPEGPFALSASWSPPMPRTQDPSVRIPGIRPNFTATRWLVTYRRPLGAPVEAEGEYLTRDSTLVAGVCVSRAWNAGNQGSFLREVVALWLDDGPWASSPQGALFAAWLKLGVGWNFIPVATSKSTANWVDAASAPVDQATISWENKGCSHLL